MLRLDTSVQELMGVGKTTCERLKKLGVEVSQDLLFYFPFRYEDFSKILPISQLQPGENATVKARIDLIENRRSPIRRKIITEAIISDDTGALKVIWFGQPFLTKILKPGQKIFLAGRAEDDKFGLCMVSPIYELAKTESRLLHTGRLVPVYSLTAGLTEKQIRALVKITLPLTSYLKDWLPLLIRRNLKFLDLTIALRQIHFPNNYSLLRQAEERLKFDELFLLQLRSRLFRQKLQQYLAPAIKFFQPATKRFVAQLPFQLTACQKKATWEILNDLQQRRPMNRLLEGDVGSGKTVVASAAILNVILSGYQAAYLAPTEILAQQQFEKLQQYFKNFGLRIGLLTHSKRMVNFGGEKKKRFYQQKKNFIAALKDGATQVLIGTHALLEEDIDFNRLALLIVDEQHRFGVKQRAYLQRKRKEIADGLATTIPHLLSMTATPIPRTLAIVLYGDLDISILDEPLPGRKKVLTKIVHPDNRQKAYDFIREQIKKGRQAFVICPLIDVSDKLGVKAATAEYNKLSKEVFPEFQVGLLHGRLKSTQKDKVMQDFLANQLQILVATAVVEVGIDVPNAAVMMIESAERFGLAQLHQLRGRVGRSQHQSFCFLFTEKETEKTKKRLEALLTSASSFALAEKDLLLRGPGEIFGTSQSGFSELKIATLTDHLLIKQAQVWAEKLISQDSSLRSFPLLLEKLKELQFIYHPE